MNEVKIIAVEAGNKIALPAEWAAELHLAPTAAVEKLANAILVRPSQPTTRLTWDEIFAEKLQPGQVQMERDLTELSGDHLIFRHNRFSPVLHASSRSFVDELFFS